MQSKPSRPTGVTILAVLSILSGLALLFAGGAALGASATFATQLGVASGIAAAIGAVLLVLGIIYLAVAAGFLGAKGWSWTLALIAYIVGIILTITQIALAPSANLAGNIVGLIFALLILYYLFRPNVRAYFGKGGTLPMGATKTPSTTTN
jgi:lysylphosphatidylglycerol synthetase-like protein (DUF2156 family)